MARRYWQNGAVPMLLVIMYGKHYLDISFAAEIVSGEPKNCEPDRIESIAWYPLDNLPEPLFEPVRITLEAVKTGRVFFEINETK